MPPPPKEYRSTNAPHLIQIRSTSSSLIQDVTNETPDLCHTVIKHKDVHVTWGQSVHLPCRFNGFIQETQDLQQLLAAQQKQQHHQLGRYGQTGPLTDESFGLQGQTGGSFGQPHGLSQPANYIQWYYHRRDNVLSPGYPVLQRRDKFILAADQGLVILNANEPGWYQCRLGNQIIYSYNLIIDTSKFNRDKSKLAILELNKFMSNNFLCFSQTLETCATPNESDFRRIYADWCREIERYKSAYRNWHAKQNVSSHELVGPNGASLFVSLLSIVDRVNLRQMLTYVRLPSIEPQQRCQLMSANQQQQQQQQQLLQLQKQQPGHQDLWSSQG